MNPYEVSPTVLDHGGTTFRECIQCGSQAAIRTDKKFPRLNLALWILGGWVVFIFRYAFVCPVDTCQECGARVHVKSLGSLITMILILICLLILPGLILDWLG